MFVGVSEVELGWKRSRSEGFVYQANATVRTELARKIMRVTDDL